MPNFSWRPHKGPQEQFHRSRAFEVFYGGAAGGGKSDSLLMEALRYVHVPGYAAVLFRRTFKELSQARGLIERSREVCPEFEGRYNEQRYEWRFPCGSLLQFSHLEHESDKENHRSAEYAYIGFDELTSFTESQYLYLFSRCRTTAIDPRTRLPVPARVRAGSNPGDVGHDWVKARFGPWLDRDYEGDRAQTGDIRSFIRTDDVDIECAANAPQALTRQFIAANLYDNPTLMQNDPQYEARLNALPIIDRERLLAGNWDLLVQGKIFKPEWFDQFVYTRPEGFRWFRYWDLAASVRTHADFSASPAVAFDPKKGVLYVADMRKMKAEWPDVQVEIKHLMMTETDVVETGIEKKMHGLAAFQTMMRDPDLLGHRLVAVEVKGDKLERAMHWQERAAQHKVVLVHGQWVNSFINEAALFDGTGKTHDDMVDGVSGANLMAANPKWRSLQFLRL